MSFQDEEVVEDMDTVSSFPFAREIVESVIQNDYFTLPQNEDEKGRGKNSRFEYGSKFVCCCLCHRKCCPRYILYLLVSSLFFELFMAIVVVCNLVLMSLQPPVAYRENGRNRVIFEISQYINLLFLSIYTTEILLKSFAYGFFSFRDKRTYLRRSIWNVFDTIIVVFGWASLFCYFAFDLDYVYNVTILRGFSVLQIFLKFNCLNEVKAIIESLSRSISLLKDVLLLISFLIIVYSVLGLELFVNSLQRRCLLRNEETGEYEEAIPSIYCKFNVSSTSTSSSRDSSSLFFNYCPTDMECVNTENNILLHGIPNYDDFLSTFLYLLQASSLTGWASELLLPLMEAEISIFVSFYFLTFVGLITFVVMNLFVAILTFVFFKIRNEQKLKQKTKNKEQREQEEMKQKKKGVIRMIYKPVKKFVQNCSKKTAIVGSPTSPLSPIRNYERIRRTRFSVYNNLNKNRKDSEDRKMGKKKRALIVVQGTSEMCLGCAGLCCCGSCYVTNRIVNNNIFFEIIVTCIIFANVILESTCYIGMNHTHRQIVEYSSYVFLAIYLFEVVFLRFCCGSACHICFFLTSDKFNVFDIMLLSFAVLTIILKYTVSSNYFMYKIIFLRVLRILKVLERLPGSFGQQIRSLVRNIVKSFIPVLNTFLFISYCLLMYGVIGYQIFGHRLLTEEDGRTVSIHDNFDHIGNGMITLFKIMTSDGWYASFYLAASTINRYGSIIFFVTFYILSTYVFMSLFTSVVLENFSEEDVEDEGEGEEEENTSSNRRKRRRKFVFRELGMCVIDFFRVCVLAVFSMVVKVVEKVKSMKKEEVEVKEETKEDGDDDDNNSDFDIIKLEDIESEEEEEEGESRKEDEEGSSDVCILVNDEDQEQQQQQQQPSVSTSDEDEEIEELEFISKLRLRRCLRPMTAATITNMKEEEEKYELGSSSSESGSTNHSQSDVSSLSTSSEERQQQRKELKEECEEEENDFEDVITKKKKKRLGKEFLEISKKKKKRMRRGDIPIDKFFKQVVDNSMKGQNWMSSNRRKKQQIEQHQQEQEQLQKPSTVKKKKKKKKKKKLTPKEEEEEEETEFQKMKKVVAVSIQDCLRFSSRCCCCSKSLIFKLFFKYFIGMVIVFNIVISTLQDSRSAIIEVNEETNIYENYTKMRKGQIAVYYVCEMVVFFIFGVELVLNLVLMRYLNFVKLFPIYVISLSGFILVPYFPQHSIFRLMRYVILVRIFEVIAAKKGLREMITSLVYSIPSLFGVIIFSSFVMFLFALTGRIFFGGKFHMCNDVRFDEVDCNGYFYESENNIFVPRVWSVRRRNFDSLISSYLTLMEITTMSDWASVMYHGQSVTLEGQAPRRYSSYVYFVYFIIFIMFGGIFVVNLLVGVLLDNFDQKRGLDLTEEQEHYIKFVEDRLEKVKAIEDKNQVNKENRRQRSLSRNLLHYVWSSYAFFCCCVFCGNSVIRRFARWKAFRCLVVVFIISHIGVMLTKHSGQEPIWCWIQLSFAVLFSAFFLFESVMKICGFGVTKYFRTGWNLFDFILSIMLAVSSIIEVSMLPSSNYCQQDPSASSSSTVVLTVNTFRRIARVSKIFSLIQYSEGLSLLFKTLVNATSKLLDTMILLSTLFFVYTLIGMAIFGQLRFGRSVRTFVNFRHFFPASLSLVRISTFDAWNDILGEGLRTEPDCTNGYFQDDEGHGVYINDCGPGMIVTYLYFFSFYLIGSYVFLNVVVTVILDKFQFIFKRIEDPSNALSDIQHEIFISWWQRVDMRGKGRINRTRLKYLIQSLWEEERSSYGFPIPKNLFAFNLLAEVIHLRRTDRLIEEKKNKNVGKLKKVKLGLQERIERLLRRGDYNDRDNVVLLDLFLSNSSTRNLLMEKMGVTNNYEKNEQQQQQQQEEEEEEVETEEEWFYFSDVLLTLVEFKLDPHWFTSAELYRRREKLKIAVVRSSARIILNQFIRKSYERRKDLMDFLYSSVNNSLSSEEEEEEEEILEIEGEKEVDRPKEESEEVVVIDNLSGEDKERVVLLSSHVESTEDFTEKSEGNEVEEGFTATATEDEAREDSSVLGENDDIEAEFGEYDYEEEEKDELSVGDVKPHLFTEVWNDNCHKNLSPPPKKAESVKIERPHTVGSYYKDMSGKMKKKRSNSVEM